MEFGGLERILFASDLESVKASLSLGAFDSVICVFHLCRVIELGGDFGDANLELVMVRRLDRSASVGSVKGERLILRIAEVLVFDGRFVNDSGDSCPETISFVGLSCPFEKLYFVFFHCVGVLLCIVCFCFVLRCQSMCDLPITNDSSQRHSLMQQENIAFLRAHKEA